VLDRAGAVPGLASQEVGRAQDLLMAVQVAVDLVAVVGVIAERDHVHAGGEHLIGDLGCYPEPTRGVLAVDHDERGALALLQHGQAVEQRVASDAAHDIAHEQDPRLVRGRRLGDGGRLGLSHTLPMAGGK